MRKVSSGKRREPPRAPSQAAWDAMTDSERAAVVEALPSHIPWEELRPPEGDAHMDAKIDAMRTLRDFYRSTARKIYISSELAIYYPDERRFAPDLIAVRDAEQIQREKWVVSAEGKGLDLALEVHLKGSTKKDLELNVERFARLGIPEYFIYDRRRQKLRGFRLPTTSDRVYVPIEPIAGRLPSEILGLDLVLEDDRLRFYAGTACLLDSGDLVGRLGKLVAQVEANADIRIRELEERAAAEAERAAAQAAKADEERKRVAELQARLAEYEQRFGKLG